MNLEKEIFEISLSDIMPNRFQPREIFEDNSLNELAESIKQHGIIQPIIVRKVGDKYEIIAGERRFRASKLAGQKTIPALIRNIDDKEAAKIALLENLQRQNLSPIEEAKTYQTILKLDNLTQGGLATNLGKSQSAIANKLRLLNLTEEVQTALLNNEISERHARSLLLLPKNEQKIFLDKIINERLTVKQLDDLINNQIKNESANNQTENDLKDKNNAEPKNYEIKNEENKVDKQLNIFDKLRVDNKQKENLNIKDSEQKSEENIVNNNLNTSQNNNFVNPNMFSDTQKYDLRFAINNFRQAIQNTEKFGFKVTTQEFENNENYQLVVTIKKKS